MKIAVNSLLSLLDVGTGFCYWLLGRDLLEDEIKRIEQLFIKGIVILLIHSPHQSSNFLVQKPEDECDLINELNSLSPSKDLLLVCDGKNHNLVQWCVLNHYTRGLLVLLEYGCNPSRTGLSGYDLPLALACCLGHRDMIELLLNYGANPSGTTMLSASILTYLSEERHDERYLKLMDLFKYRTSITSLNIVLIFDDLAMFHLLMGETSCSTSVSGSSTSLCSAVNMTHTIDDCPMRIAETDFDIFREKLKIDNYVENILRQDGEECLEQTTPQQQQMITNDDLSDCAEHGHLFSFCDTLDGESAVVNQDEGMQVS